MRGFERRARDVTPVWRRVAMGTNHIACSGVWRRGTRRATPAIINAGHATRWHMPRRAGIPLVQPGFYQDVVVET